MLLQIDHNNVVNIYEYYLYTNDIFIVMELFTGGELFNKIVSDKKYLTENSIRKIMVDVLDAVSYLHKKKIGG